MTRHYCTYFDHRYFARGMAMMDSLRRHCPGARFTVLCLSDRCGHLLRKFAGKDVGIITPTDLEGAFPELSVCRTDRSLIEYYFTCTPYVLQYVLSHQEGEGPVTYVDADLWFFSSPEPLFEEMGDASVAIIPHRFPPDLAHCEAYGKYNVGWVTVRATSDGLSCLRWWAMRCAEWCHDRVDEGRFADQKYLDQFPGLFAGVRVIRHPGANLAPWNVRNHALSGGNGEVRVDGKPLLFFHFHGFEFPKRWLVALPFGLYRVALTPILKNAIVAPYLQSLKCWEKQLHRECSLPRIGFPETGEPGLLVSWRAMAAEVKSGNYLVRGPRAALLKFLGR